MGKHEVGTPKYIANKIKAKGLQKLRWYCQMCEKQCRDENGFKCHTMSESHHRQLLIFADNQHKYMDEFSREFSQGYLNLLKRQFGTKRTPANRVYQEYIADRGHVHMNATTWLSLTEFVKWLGRTGKCVVDETEKGWFVSYIDRDPETLALQEKRAKKEKMDKDDEERMMDFIEKQVKKARREVGETKDGEFKVPLTRAEDDAPVVIELKMKAKPLPIVANRSSRESATSTIAIKREPQENDPEDRPTNFTIKEEDTGSEKGKSSRKREYRKEEEEAKKQKSCGSEKRGWLRDGIVVKIVTKRLGEKYHGAKGEVQRPVLENDFVGKIKIVSPAIVEGHVVKLDQEHLETVIPAMGKEVLILQGKYENSRALVHNVRIEEFAIDVRLVEDEKIVKRLPYESVCKYVGKNR